MANESVKIKDEMSIKKTTVDEEGKPIKTTYFFPDQGRSVEASSLEEAQEILKGNKQKV